MAVDSYRYVDLGSRTVMRAWVAREPVREIPWTPLALPVAQARLALVTSAGVSRLDDQPFDQEGERRNPWWGDPSWRRIPTATTTGGVRIDHLHIDPRPGLADLDCLLPLRRAEELCRDGVLGSLAATHYSFMGYLPRPDTFLRRSVPEIVQAMRSEEVDVALLVPV